MGKRKEKGPKFSTPTPSSFKKTIYRTFSEKLGRHYFFCLLGLRWNTLCTEKYWNWTLHLCKSTLIFKNNTLHFVKY